MYTTSMPGALGNQKKASDFLKVGLQILVNFYVHTKPESSARTANALNHWVISLAPEFFS